MEKMMDVVKVREIEDGILEIILNRPQALNALNAELMEKLQDIFIAAKANHSIKALLITGEGKAFCAGADIHQLEVLNAQDGMNFARHGQSLLDMLEKLGKPSLAAVNGVALGGGCELAMATTLRMCSENAVFGLPEVKLGVIPGFGGTQRLSRLIGIGRALELCLTGRNLKANDALSWGLVTEVVPLEHLRERALDLLKGIVKLSPIALKSVMSVVYSGGSMSIDEGLALEAAHFGLCCATRDKHEGVRAFLEKRPAVFTGE